MKILIVSQYFYPENFRINDFAKEFNARGHEITVLTGTPNYPAGRYYNGYGICTNIREVINGVKIFRSPLIPRGNGSGIRLLLNYISFVIGSMFTSLFLLKNKYDIIFVFEPSPITVGIPAIFLKKLKKIPICFWVLDLWPESVISAGNIKSSLVPKLLNPLVKFIYSHCDRILVSSNGFIESICDKNISRTKINFFPQWAEEFFKPIKTEKYLLEGVPKESFKIMFAGNIGEAQDFPSILKAAGLLKENNRIQWVILGNGRKEEWVRSEIKKRNLDHCFHLLGSFSIEKMPYFYSQADCMLFSLKKEEIFSITIPAKVQSYLACSKPIVAMIDGEAAKLINKANAGLTCPSGDFSCLANNIKELSTLGEDELSIMGKNALNYYNKKFERKMLFGKLERLFHYHISRSKRLIFSV